MKMSGLNLTSMSLFAPMLCQNCQTSDISTTYWKTWVGTFVLSQPLELLHRSSVYLLRTQGTLRRRLTYLTRATPAVNTPDASGTPAPALAPVGDLDENPDADYMTEMKAKAYNLVIRMLRPGPTLRLFVIFAGMRNGNVLEAFRETDNRFVPDCEEDKEDALEVYNDWRWDVSKTFFANVSSAEQAIFDMLMFLRFEIVPVNVIRMIQTGPNGGVPIRSSRLRVMKTDRLRRQHPHGNTPRTT